MNARGAKNVDYPLILRSAVEQGPPLSPAYMPIPCCPSPSTSTPVFARQSAAEILLRSGSPDEVTLRGAGGASNPTFGTLSRSGAEAARSTRAPTTTSPGGARCGVGLNPWEEASTGPDLLLALRPAARPAGVTPESGCVRGSHHPASCGAVVGRSLGGPQWSIPPRSPGIHRGGTGHAVDPTSRAAPQPNEAKSKVSHDAYLAQPCGPAAKPPVGGPNHQPSTADGFAGRVVRCPQGDRVLAWVPASALGLLGPILRRNGLIVGEEDMLDRGDAVPGSTRIRRFERKLVRSSNRRSDWRVTAAWALIAVCLVAAVLHIAWTREERMVGRGTLSPAAVAEMPTQEVGQ